MRARAIERAPKSWAGVDPRGHVFGFFVVFYFFAEPLFFWSGCLSSACSCLPQLASDQTSFSRYILFHAPRNATTTTTRNVHLTPLPHPDPVCFLSYHSTKYFLILFSPSGLCLLELQVKLEDIISSGTQKSAESAPHTPQPSTPPSLALPPNLPPHTDPPPWPKGGGGGGGGRGIPEFSVRNVPSFCLLHRLLGSLSSSDRGGGKNKPTRREGSTNEDEKADPDPGVHVRVCVCLCV